jgi:hypothetical protein
MFFSPTDSSPNVRRILGAVFVLVVVLFSLALPSFALPAFNRVFIVVEENHSYSQVVGSPYMPYLNSLIGKYALATSYYANTHPSIGNYFMLTTGQIITNNDSFTGVVSADNIVRHLLTAGKTWKSYAENLPYAGYTGGDQFPYLKRHNPLSYFSDVVYSSEKYNLVPFSRFASDLTYGRVPQYTFIVPNAQHDAHNCPPGMSTCTDAQRLAAADSWLKTNIAPLIASSTFQKGSLLVIVFDESLTADTAHGGGHVMMVAISPFAKSGWRSPYFFQHQNVLRLMAQGLGLTSYPGAASSAANMGSLFW